MENVLVVSVEEQTSHNIPLNQSFIRSNTIALFNPFTIEGGEEATEDK